MVFSTDNCVSCFNQTVETKERACAKKFIAYWLTVRPTCPCSC